MASEGEAKNELTQGGQGGGLLEDRGHVRGDAILIRKWAGLVDPERVKPLIEKGYELAENATDERGYASVMKVIQGFAKLEQDEERDRSPKKVVNIQNNVHLGTPEQRADSLEARLIAEAQRRGIVADGIVVGDGDGSGSGDK